MNLLYLSKLSQLIFFVVRFLSFSISSMNSFDLSFYIHLNFFWRKFGKGNPFYRTTKINFAFFKTNPFSFFSLMLSVNADPISLKQLPEIVVQM